MRRTFVVALVLASFLLAVQPAAAASASIDLAVLGGGGELSNGSTVAVQGMALTVTTPRKPVSLSFANLVVDGVHTRCSVTSADCSAVPATAELSCVNASTHTVEAGAPGVSHGSLDGNELASGWIFMQCIAH